jgi:uncharacterized protein YjbI with pentapeptide repeats
MARQARRKPPAGKTVAFVGKFGYHDMFLRNYRAYVTAEGGSVVDIDAAPDYLVVGQGRGGKPPGVVAQLQKKHPAASVLDEADFCRLLLPTADELAAVLRAGRREYQYWDQIEYITRKASAVIDLGGCDLRGANLCGAKLQAVNLDKADLRKASGQYVQLGDLHNTRCDEADLSHAYFANAEGCSFRKALLHTGWLDYSKSHTFHNCDFTGANLTQCRGGNCSFTGCTFTEADLSDGELQRSDFTGVSLARANLTRGHCEQARFDRANLEGAILFRTDLRKASLAGANIRQADLRDAVLAEADLTGALVDGADFTGAVLTGAKIDGVDFSAAKGYQAPAGRAPGPKMRELAQVATVATKLFFTSVKVELGKGEHATLCVNNRIMKKRPNQLGANSQYRRDDNETVDLIPAPTFEQGMLNLAQRWPQGRLRLDTVEAGGSRSPRGQQLLALATAAWAEAFGLEATSPEELQQKKEAQQAELEQLRQTMLKELRGGAAGVKKWNARSKHEREQIGPLRDLDLRGAKLAGVELGNCDLQGSRLDGANLKKASLWSCQLQSASFVGADLSGARLAFIKAEGASFENARLCGCEIYIATLKGAVFRGADLSGSDLSRSWLEGADFTGARLDGADLGHAEYDRDTRFPQRFVPPPSMKWVGPPPGAPVSATPGSMDFSAFFEQLGYKVEAGRLAKALAMLKAERFQLFADVKDDALVGVVKSQSNPSLVYSCRLAADGTFGCCTQNLKACGGLRGSLCKHLLVLIVGLTRAGRLDPATADTWVNASKTQKPAINSDAMSETFLRYKGAEAGEVDWRPTETIPEDYYSL